MMYFCLEEYRTLRDNKDDFGSSGSSDVFPNSGIIFYYFGELFLFFFMMSCSGGFHGVEQLRVSSTWSVDNCLKMGTLENITSRLRNPRSLMEGTHRGNRGFTWKPRSSLT